MEKTAAFNVDSWTERGSGTWQVDGRAYETIRLGDVLSTHGSNERPAEPTTEFRVLAIATYRHEMEALDRGLTGTLVLKGSSDTLVASDMLYIDV